MWSTGFRFTKRFQREIQLSMVGSCGTWNMDEPGLGRPKALPSSLPCRASVIWIVLSGRHACQCPQAAHTTTPGRVCNDEAVRHRHKSLSLPRGAPATHLCPPNVPLCNLYSNPWLIYPLPLHMMLYSLCGFVTSYTNSFCSGTLMAINYNLLGLRDRFWI